MHLLPQLQSPSSALNHLLSWEEGATLLMQPDLIKWLYQVQLSAINQQSSQASMVHAAALKSASDSVINVGVWLGDRLDNLAQQLSWILMPAFAPAAALRSVRDELESRGVRIPAEARGAYRDLHIGNADLRLYAIAWTLPLTHNISGWTLLIILGAQPDVHLPPGIKLLVRDETQPLVEQVLDDEIQDAYLYAQVGGTWHEKFWVTLGFTDNSAITLPPFTFSF
jgi:hypothetical protein